MRRVPISSLRPSSARYSHCTGISTLSAAQRALRVSSSSRAGQSMRMKSYRSRRGFKASRSTVSRPSAAASWMPEPNRSRLQGITSA